MLDAVFLREFQGQVVEAGGTVVGGHAAGRVFECVGAEEHDGAEVEVVAQAALLVVDDGSVLALAVGADLIVVGIDHAGTGDVGDLHHALQGEIAHAYVAVLQKHERIACAGLVGDAVNGLGVTDVAVDDSHLIHDVEVAQSLHVALCFLFDAFWHEAIDEGIHFRIFVFNTFYIFSITCL